MSKLPPLHGAVVFITTAVAESLALEADVNNRLGGAERENATQWEPPLHPPEEVLFDGFRRRLLELQKMVPQKRCGMLQPFRVGSRFIYLAHLHRLRDFSTGSNSFFYCVNLDYLYTKVYCLFDEVHCWWEAATNGILTSDDTGRDSDNSHNCKSGYNRTGCVTEKPEILFVVLPPGGTTLWAGPGSMLPSLVILKPENPGEGGMDVRLCGFPQGVQFNVSSDRLRQLSTSHSGKPGGGLGSGGDWFNVQPREFVLSRDWCTATFVSSDFVKHSLFFLEWCVPGDFVWMPPQSRKSWPSERVNEEGWGWGCDALGKLLRCTSEILTEDVDTDDMPPSKRYRHKDCHDCTSSSSSSPVCAEAFVDFAPLPFLRPVDSLEALEDAKQHVDTRFVKAIYETASTPRRDLVLKAMLAQLKLVKEVYFTHTVRGCGAIDTTDANEKIPLVRRCSRLLKIWEERCFSRTNISAPCNGHPFTHMMEVDQEKENAMTPFLERLRWRFARSKPRRLGPLLLTGDGEKLLGTPCIAEETLQLSQDDAVEVADVVELIIALNASPGYRGDVVLPCDRDPASRIPKGHLRGILDASAAAYISLACSKDSKWVVDDASSLGLDESVMGAEDECRPCDGGGSMLDVMSATFFTSMKAMNKDGLSEYGQTRSDLTGLSIIKRFWDAVKKENSTASDCIGTDHTSTNKSVEDAPGAGSIEFPMARDVLQTVMEQEAHNSKSSEERSRGGRWLRHLALLMTHASTPLPRSHSVERTAETTGKERKRRVVRGLEAHLFFVDAALCALDSAISRRWEQARANLERSYTE